MTDKDRAEAYRMAADYLWELDLQVTAGRLRDKADELDPPTKIDTSLRGWVLLTDDAGHETVLWAREDGLYGARRSSLLEWLWERLTDTKWTVRSLTPEDIGYRVRKWDEWSENERRKWFGTWGGYSGDAANYAIEIATRRDV